MTQNDILSDHNILTFNYNNNKLNKKPTYKIKRDFNLLNTDILTQSCDMNDRIDTVFDYDMSNDIADILIDEITNIIQTIAPKTTFSILDQTIKLTSNDRCLTRRILYSLSWPKVWNCGFLDLLVLGSLITDH